MYFCMLSLLTSLTRPNVTDDVVVPSVYGVLCVCRWLAFGGAMTSNVAAASRGVLAKVG